MTRAKLNHFRKLLTDYSNRANGTARGLEDQARFPVMGDTVRNISNNPIHLGDAGTAMFDQELNATLPEHEEHVMTEIADALGRIDAGTLGVCENGGKKIPEGRLEAAPYARYCLPCTKKLGDEYIANLIEGRPEASRGTITPTRERHPSGETSNTELLGADRPPIAEMDPDQDKPDIHAAGTPGGGSAVRGLAGTTIGDGQPAGAGLEDAIGSGAFDAEVADAEDNQAYARRAGGAVGGTPAGKRSRGDRTHRGIAPKPDGLG
jgi:RNA polymerase-binding transcription factor DksA